jgi:hypothetical protein
MSVERGLRALMLLSETRHLPEKIRLATEMPRVTLVGSKCFTQSRTATLIFQLTSFDARSNCFAITDASD